MKSTLAIISDDILYSNLFIPLLKKELPDLHIYICRSFQEIKDKIDHVSCDLILIDGGLTTSSSLEIIHFIRNKKLVVAPIWFFPEIITTEYIHKSKEMGATKIINKPFDPYVITNEIASLINH